MENKELLDKIIVGRVEPHIYAFTTNTIPNYLKVGDTYRPVSVRLNEWKEVYPELKKEYEKKAMVDENIFFRDYAVHHYLENDLNKERINPNDFSNIYVSNEFFKETSVIDVESAIEDIQKSYEENLMKYQYYNANSRLRTIERYVSTGYWKPRPNQQTVIDKFVEAYKKGRNNLLMYAIMRFGKSFTSMCCALEMDANIVVIVSAKADVKEEWKKTVESAENFNEYDFLTSEDLLDENIIKNKRRENRRLAIFLTLQDLQGTEIKEKHKELFNNQIDLLLIDETHFGVRADKYGAVLRAGFKDVNETREDGFVDFEDANNQVKALNSKIRIHLSGTPYRILMGSEFSHDDIIAFCQFSDIVSEQEKWDNEHFKDIENGVINDETGKPYEEWDNPYFGFPQMIRFAFNPNESVRRRLEKLKNNGNFYAFSELLRTNSIRQNSNGEHKKFIYESEVLDLLEVIDGTKGDVNVLGFLDYDKIKEGKMCRHIVMVLPYRASCDALEELIKNNSDKFKNLNEYEIINISGVDKPNLYKNVKDIKNKIKDYEKENKKTLTLTVNRMLTGSTVEEWDTMIYLKDTSSPQEYDQAIFRLQNQYVKDYLSSNGDLIKYNKKPQTLLVDFDPNRMFIMQETKAMIYNANVDKSGNSKLEERIRNELNISPIIVLNKNKIQKIQAIDIMNAISNYSKDRGVFEEAGDIPVDLSLIAVPEIFEVISKQGEFGTRQGFRVNNTDTDSDDNDSFDFGELSETLFDYPQDTEIESQTGTSSNQKEKNDIKSNLTKQFRTYYARILFFAILTKDSVSSLEDIINVINQGENKRIANHLGLSKEVLFLINKEIDIFILRQLDYKIQNINSLSNDDSLSEIERATIAINKFDKLSDSEVITPQNVCRDMLEMIGKDKIVDIINNKGNILDIASKEAEFMLSLVNILKENNVSNERYKNNLYSIPTSGVAYEFTRKIYEILGLNISNISEKFDSYDLLNVKTDDNIDYEKIVNYITQTQTFSDIELDDNLFSNMKGDERMHFDIVVGNPPYQEADGGAGASARPIYNYFVNLSKKLDPKFVSLIIPSRWYVGGKGLDEFRKDMVNDIHIKELHDCLTPDDIFPNTNNRGGICYWLWDKSYNNKENSVKIITHSNNKVVDEMIRPLKLYDEDIFIRDSRAKTILDKIVTKDFKSFSEIVSSRKPFGLDGNFARSNKITNEKTKENTVICYIKGKKKVFVNLKSILCHGDWVDSWKVFIPRANNIGTELNDDNMNSFVGEPNTICTESYLVVGADLSLNQETSKNLAKYLQTKFLRYLHSLLKSSQDATSKTFSYVPIEDFGENSSIDWSKSVSEIDMQLYEKYSLEKEEINHIEEKIKPMEQL